MVCHIGQHDFEQIKIYISQLNTYVLGKSIKEEVDDEEVEDEEPEPEPEDEEEEEEEDDDDDELSLAK